MSLSETIRAMQAGWMPFIMTPMTPIGLTVTEVRQQTLPQ